MAGPELGISAESASSAAMGDLPLGEPNAFLENVFIPRHSWAKGPRDYVMLPVTFGSEDAPACVKTMEE